LLNLFSGKSLYDAYRHILSNVSKDYGLTLPEWEVIPGIFRLAFTHLADWCNKQVEALINQMLREAA
jgi:hypothetical protein